MEIYAIWQVRSSPASSSILFLPFGISFTWNKRLLSTLSAIICQKSLYMLQSWRNYGKVCSVFKDTMICPNHPYVVLSRKIHVYAKSTMNCNVWYKKNIFLTNCPCWFVYNNTTGNIQYFVYNIKDELINAHSVDKVP